MSKRSETQKSSYCMISFLGSSETELICGDRDQNSGYLGSMVLTEKGYEEHSGAWEMLISWSKLDHTGVYIFKNQAVHSRVLVYFI